MLVPSLVAGLLGLAFLGLWLGKRTPGALLAALGWLLYAPYEFLMHARVLCSGECNIRIDLMLLWPLLLFASLAVPVRLRAARWRARR